MGFIEWCLDNLNYWTITLLMTIESSFIPFPSEVVVPPAAYLAATEGKLNVYLVVAFSTFGAAIGAVINYTLALWLGRPIVYAFVKSKVGRLFLLNEEKVQRAERYFDKNGVISTLVGRLVPGIRQLISIPAGLARMSFGKFVLYTAIGAGIWNVVLAIIGYSLAFVPGINTREQLLEKVNSYSHLIGYAILAIVAVALIFIFVKQSRKTKTKTEQ